MVLLLLLTVNPTLRGAELTIDFSRTNGVVRSLHGANGGPLCYRGLVDLSEYHKELALPLSRLHDAPWANFEAVDIHHIFRDFRNDPGLPENYDFAATDDFVVSVIEAGSPVLYRLGESIEHTPRKYRVNPPKDFAKWADVCAGIVRHYNEGWASGFHHGIRYWEIWNEPDNKPSMWTGTDAQFLELYSITAKRLKTRWPDLKVGGPGLANAGRVENTAFIPSPYALRFLEHCRKQDVPLDFFSWHRYTKDPAEYAVLARGVRRMLDEHGFQKTESHLNEWNYLPDGNWKPLTRAGQGIERERWIGEIQGPSGAAFAAWVLISLQDEPVEMANIFTADNQILGMFSPDGVPRKNYHAFKAFRSLVDMPVRVTTASPRHGEVAVCAALDAEKRTARVLVSRFYTRELPGIVVRGLPWKGATSIEVAIIDGDWDLEPLKGIRIGPDGRIALPEGGSPSVFLVTLRNQ